MLVVFWGGENVHVFTVLVYIQDLNNEPASLIVYRCLANTCGPTQKSVCVPLRCDMKEFSKEVKVTH